eukprot:CAMPEP_0197863096 /NCGR_PEP_ID=MMETSP1438-20131217/40334_1 /TAXON_ID=1461541 /ORGANISM="Pterosperma sp., Strain CCMP1384" /LENGTH=92 /DNA_ID=CAMNT_0043480873 /DNA_START=416 /DNA_END=690 /DNA_ORIENTATION=-
MTDVERQAPSLSDQIWSWVGAAVPFALILVVTIGFIDFQEMLELDAIHDAKVKLRQSFIEEHHLFRTNSTDEDILGKVQRLGVAYDGSEDFG